MRLHGGARFQSEVSLKGVGVGDRRRMIVLRKTQGLKTQELQTPGQLRAFSEGAQPGLEVPTRTAADDWMAGELASTTPPGQGRWAPRPLRPLRPKWR